MIGRSGGPVWSTSQPRHKRDDLTEVCHSHDFQELAIIIAGTAVHHTATGIQEVSAGDVFCLSAHHWHYFSNRRGLDHINVSWYQHELHLPVDDLQRLPGYRMVFEIEPLIERTPGPPWLRLDPRRLTEAEAIITRMEQATAVDDASTRPLLTAYLTELMVMMSRCAQRNLDPTAHRPMRLATILTDIEEAPERPWTLDGLARRAGMSRRAFSAYFQQALGTSPIAYVVQLRCRRAARDLRRTQDSITDIALRHGFNDGNYFSRTFTKVMGLPPRTYRKGGDVRDGDTRAPTL